MLPDPGAAEHLERLHAPHDVEGVAAEGGQPPPLLPRLRPGMPELTASRATSTTSSAASVPESEAAVSPRAATARARASRPVWARISPVPTNPSATVSTRWARAAPA